MVCFFASRRRHTRCALVTGVQTCALPIYWSEDGRHDGTLFVSRVVGADLEALRLERVHIALDRKLGKLADCRAEGDKTVLVLEFSDIVLTNHILIGEALEVALDGRDDIPDLLLIADTTLSQRWNLFPAVIERVFPINMEWKIGRESYR